MEFDPGDPKKCVRSPRSGVVVWLLAFCCALLGASNLATLLSDRVHAMAYAGVRDVLSAAVVTNAALA